MKEKNIEDELDLVDGEKIKGRKWKVKCPLCEEEVITNCWGCVSGNTLFHWHKGKEDPDVLDLDDYNLKWKEIKSKKKN